MRKRCSFNILYVLLASLGVCRAENVLMTEVFEIKVNPLMFNWTFDGISDQFVYQASLLNAPDLPKWINYIYSGRHGAGFLYGVPPNRMELVTLEIVGLNRMNYETRRVVLPISITEKLSPARYEVQLKIDNLNVEDMFDVERMDRLKDVFRKRLWKDSEEDLYVTFLASAIELGARLPLNPDEGDGVVLRIGSRVPLSQELIELQEEVKPLWKVPLCPRDFKRTTVERFFREAGFALDWCAFRLLEDNSSAMQHSSSSIENVLMIRKDHDLGLPDHWESVLIDDVPERSYVHEFLFTILIPMFLMTILALALSLILCFHHEGISKQRRGNEEDESNHQFASIQRATQSLRNFSTSRDFSCLSPESVHQHLKATNTTTSSSRGVATASSDGGSPPFNTSTMTTTASGKGIHCRPSPPPYVRPKFKPDF
ncbi:PREDICTED: epsilon-sarcoglycan isoform X2 [Nicrophorus vespilloides]|uniref:Epsilon-sarcoglycan isoform X2 n=1 Tax=Nicrophorus vespilloides TaxID=110193 RepID=A0ABM1M9K5_NICVS|nr:PREDICTED: epsilon-sarcoglycan isoform X2 [Nicrophorus vespilloides]